MCEKWFPWFFWFFSHEVTNSQIVENGISGKSAKNGPTSQMRSIFFRYTINVHKSVRLGFTKIVWEGCWRYALCKYTILELKYYIFQKKIFHGRKTDFRWFFRTQKLKKSIFKGFMKNHDFRPKIMTWGLIIGCKNNFLNNFS